MKLHPLIILFLLISIPLCGQAVQLKFMQTEYDVRELAMISSTEGFAVGDAHWYQTGRTYRSTILQTSDGGAHWQPVDVDVNGDLSDICFPDGQNGWTGGTEGLLLRSTDGGQSWQEVSNPFLHDIRSLSFPDAQTGWVMTNEAVAFDPFDEPEGWEAHVWMTEDGGASWTEQSLPPGAGLLHRICFRSASEGWAMGVKNMQLEPWVETGCALYHTVDGGVNWTEAFVPGIDLVFTDIDFPDDTTGFLIGFAGNSAENGGNIFRTTDGGVSWERMGGDDILWEVSFIDEQKGYIVGHDPISAWGPPVYRTRDGGEIWEKIPMDKHYGQGLFGLYLDNDRVMALGESGYLVSSDDPWGTYDMWAPEQLFDQVLIDTLYQWEDIVFINPDTGWVAGQMSVNPEDWAKVILQTVDGGTSWEQQYSFYSPDWMTQAQRVDVIKFLNDSVGWAAGHTVDVGEALTSGLLYTEDGGRYWEERAFGITEGELVDLDFVNPQEGWILSDVPSMNGNIKLLKTVDGGEEWTWVDTGIPGSITIGFAVRAGKVVFRDSQEGWVLGAQCDLLRTTDGGESWERVQLPDDWVNTHALAFAGSQKASICGESVYHSIDGGLHWEDRSVAQLHFTDLCFPDSLQGWMVGEYGSIYYSLNGGDSWIKAAHEGPEVAWKAVSFPAEGDGWVCGRGGVIARLDTALLRTAQGSTGVAKLEPNRGTDKFHNFPNPFGTNTTIAFTLEQGAEVRLAIYDIRGRLLRKLAQGSLPAGSHQISYDGRDANGKALDPGVYICRLTGGGKSMSIQMIVH